MPNEIGYGFKLPIDGEDSSSWFDLLEELIEKIAVHNHDSVNSAPVDLSSIDKKESILSPIGWNIDSVGNYKQTVTLPSGVESSQVDFICINTVSGERLYPTINITSPTTIDVTINTNQLEIKILYV